MRTYIAEVAGKDSIAAINMVMRQNKKAVIIPSIVYTRTEYGGYDSYLKSLEFLRKKAEEYDVIMKDLQDLSDEKLWNILCMKYQYQIFQKFGCYSPCIMCHLFAHILRVPLYHEYGADAMITGERFLHNTTQKMNQHPLTLECFKRILSCAGVTLEQPLSAIADTDVVNSEIGDTYIIEHANDTKCVLSGNLNGYSFKESEWKVFLHEFVEPIGIYLVKQLQKEQRIAYADLDLFVGGLF